MLKSMALIMVRYVFSHRKNDYYAYLLCHVSYTSLAFPLIRYKKCLLHGDLERRYKIGDLHGVISWFYCLERV